LVWSNRFILDLDGTPSAPYGARVRIARDA
jgi:hypothetical protein